MDHLGSRLLPHRELLQLLQDFISKLEPAACRGAEGVRCWRGLHKVLRLRVSIDVAVFVLAALLPASVSAQTFAAHKVYGRYQQALWQEPQGLPQNTVFSMTRTRDGYLWLATVDGAARFDGVRFTVFDPTNTPEIRGAVIASVVEDDAGVLWLAPDNGGLVRYADGRFARVTTADGLVDDHPRALLRGRHGDLWIGAVAGLSRLRSGRFTTVTTGKDLPDPFVTALAEDDEGGLWIGTIGGLARLKDDRIAAFTERDGLPAGAIHALWWDPAGQLWIGSDGGLARWADGRFTAGPREDSHNWRSRRCVSIAKARCGSARRIGVCCGSLAIGSSRTRAATDSPGIASRRSIRIPTTMSGWARLPGSCGCGTHDSTR